MANIWAIFVAGSLISFFPAYMVMARMEQRQKLRCRNSIAPHDSQARRRSDFVGLLRHESARRIDRVLTTAIANFDDTSNSGALSQAKMRQSCQLRLLEIEPLVAQLFGDELTASYRRCVHAISQASPGSRPALDRMRAEFVSRLEGAMQYRQSRAVPSAKRRLGWHGRRRNAIAATKT